MLLSVSPTFSQVNEDFSWVKKNQIKTVKITSPEDSERKEFEEIFEYDLNGALVRHELTEDIFKKIKEFNSQGLIELDAELVRFDGELYFDTSDVTYYEYEEDRIKKEITLKFDVWKGDRTTELSFKSTSSWHYRPQLMVVADDYVDYETHSKDSRGSHKRIHYLNSHGADSILYVLVGNGDTINTRISEYEYDNLNRKKKSIEKYISIDNVSVSESTFEYWGQSKILSSLKIVHYNEDKPSKMRTTLYKYSRNGNIKSKTEIDKSGEKMKRRVKPPKPKYDLKSQLKKTDNSISIIYYAE